MGLDKSSLVDYQDWTKRKAGKIASIDFVRFSMVGATGFLVNTIFLTLFYRIFHFPLLVSQIMAAELALTSNFILHNTWTYKSSSNSVGWVKKYLIFHGSSWLGIAITTLVLLFVVNILHKNYMIGLIVGSTITMFWNFSWTKFVIFKRQKSISNIE